MAERQDTHSERVLHLLHFMQRQEPEVSEDEEMDAKDDTPTTPTATPTTEDQSDPSTATPRNYLCTIKRLLCLILPCRASDTIFKKGNRSKNNLANGPFQIVLILRF